MQPLSLLGAIAVLATFGWFAAANPSSSSPSTPPAPQGHFVLVVEGHREALTITAASRKADAWSGPREGLASKWRLRIDDAQGARLADVPLDVAPFDVAEGALLRPVRVEGCIVTSPAIGMLVTAPAFAAAARYTFVRPGSGAEAAEVVIGAVDGAAVRTLAGDGR